MSPARTIASKTTISHRVVLERLGLAVFVDGGNLTFVQLTPEGVATRDSLSITRVLRENEGARSKIRLRIRKEYTRPARKPDETALAWTCPDEPYIKIDDKKT
jgi:hypothetical protein